MLFWLLLSLAIQRPAPALHLEAVPAKQTYQAGEAVAVSLVLKNDGKIPMDVRGENTIVLLTGPGERPMTVPPPSGMFDLGPANERRLKPGETIAAPLALSSLIPLTDSGTYLLQVIYEAGAPGRIVSKPAVFDIVPNFSAPLPETPPSVVLPIPPSPLIHRNPHGRAPQKTFPLKDSVFYTPPFLHSTDSYFKAGWRGADGAPVSGASVLVAQAEEAGYTILKTVATDENGETLIRLNAPPSAPLLIVPLGEGAPFPHRIPIAPVPAASSNVPENGPQLLFPPDAVEPNTEQIFSGVNLLPEDGKAALTMSGSGLSILAAAPSFLLAEISSRLPGPQTFAVTNSLGSSQMTVPLVVVRGKVQPADLARGKSGALTLEEWGLPQADAWAAADNPDVALENGGQREIVSLAEETPKAVSIQGIVPGPFHLAFGIVEPGREAALARLQTLRAGLMNPDLLNLLNKAAWSLQLGEIGRTESLLEELRYGAFLRENKSLPVDEVLEQPRQH